MKLQNKKTGEIIDTKDLIISEWFNKVIGEYGNVSYKLFCTATNTEEKDLELLFGGEDDN